MYGKGQWVLGVMCFVLLIVVWCFSLGSSTEQTPVNSVQSNSTLIRRRRAYLVYSCAPALVLNYTRNTRAMFTFDLCSVIDCGSDPTIWREFNVYLCAPFLQMNECEGYGRYRRGGLCAWGDMTKYTGNWDPSAQWGLDDKRARWWRSVSFQRDYSPSANPVSLSLSPLKTSAYGYDRAYFYLGVDVSGADPLRLIRINFRDPPQRTAVGPGKVRPTPLSLQPKVVQVDYSNLKPLDVIQMATGYQDDNLWLNWVAQMAKEQRLGNCVACASARPHLYTDPAPLFPNDTWVYNCMLGLTRQATPVNCTTLAALFPPIDNATKTGPFAPYKGNGTYTCFNITHASPEYDLGRIPNGWCAVNISSRDSSVIGHWARAGLYYYCGGNHLFARVPPKSVGYCAMVRLQAPLMLVGQKLRRVPLDAPESINLIRRRRRRVLVKRGSTPSFDLSVNSPTYIDAIGVPRGVPNEYKLADQIAAGFENIPIISALFSVTPNKNVDRINYVHYNVLRLANLTRDAVEGLAEQVGPTSLMSVQNRMALDMLLAEKGGVCAMFGDMCCTFIPNNTAPDGSVSKALEGLRTLSETMHAHSGINNPLEDWMTGLFGQWKNLIMSILISVAVFVAILVTCGCCCIPCIRSLTVRLISSTIEKQDPKVMMPLLAPEPEGLGFELEVQMMAFE